MKNWFYPWVLPNSIIVLCRAKMLFAAVLFLCPQTKAQVNVYHPLPDSNAVWGMMAWCSDWNCGTYRYVQYYMAGDTVIDGATYKIIGQSVSVDYEGGCTCQVPEDLGEGYLREDTAARKVYWRIPGSDTDTLLYDFTLEPGDTLNGLAGNTDMCGSFVFTVQSIDSILEGSSYRKRINFFADPCNPFSIIEGLGSTAGLTACYIPAPASAGIQLHCVTVEDSVLYTAPCAPSLLTCGELETGVLEGMGPAGGPITLQPNPTTGMVKLVGHFDHSPLDLLICDVAGKAVYRSRLFQGKSTIDISTLGKGLYIALVFRNGVLVRSEKLVKE